MTPAKSDLTNVVVVDGSNIATEGRSMPSLAQLQEAVMAFTEEYPDAVVTVVVDATFGHRIDKKELAEFDAAVAHNELVAPPAGAIGRGDAFVLSIANKVGARILSNDSFQEFHGDYPWLFDEGRLIGGKPVPFVGWVFVDRLPVKGAVSRKATRNGRNGGRGDTRPPRRTVSKAASLPMPVPKEPPPRAGRPAESPAAAATAPAPSAPEASPRPAATNGGAVNDLLPFLDFVEHHPVGSSVTGVVESYSSHGAYVAIGDLRGYVPLRLMGDPPPRSARELLKLGDAVTLVVTSFAPARRSVDLAIPKAAAVGEPAPSPMLDDLTAAVNTPPPAPSRRRTTKRSAASTPEMPVGDGDGDAPAVDGDAPTEAAPVARRRTAKRAAPTAAPDVPAAETLDATPEPAPRKRAAAKRAPAKTTIAAEVPVEPVGQDNEAAVQEPTDEPAPKKKAPARKAPARKAAAKKQAPATEPTATDEGPVTEPPAKKVAAKKAPAKKAAAKKVAGTKKAATKKAAPPTVADTNGAADDDAGATVAAPATKRASKAGSTTPAKRAPRKVAAPAESGDA